MNLIDQLRIGDLHGEQQALRRAVGVRGQPLRPQIIAREIRFALDKAGLAPA